MKPHPAHRAGRQQIAAPSHHVPSAVPVHHAPNAALLIDFDNVTLGIRSDLAKELRTLLNSDIIKGKVAVQRAYADWRRYPQYIVSLSESSIDLIFAPAFGTNKKNATDIRLAVDAIELVFTRPEIGTFMLLSGDSDFSSLVLKLKEYGKYVIGVGIRESASDILIQNCDEYYSYSDLAGLSKEADVASPPRDPWELVVDAVEQMARNHDVMRADRLKQVMQQIDPAFDESNAGYNRFSKFVTEAGTRGLIRVIKQDNGQLDVAPGATSSPAPAARRGREASVLSERAPAAALPAEKDAASHPVRRRRGGRGRGRSPDAGEVTAKPAISGSAAGGRASTGLTLAEAFHLLARALGELPAPVPHEALRARMAALHGKEDSLLEPLRFAKLLRQANDAEIADIRMVAEDQYEISPHKADLAFKMQARPPIAAVTAGETAAPAAVRPAAALRFRGGSRTGTRPSELQMVGVVELNAGTPAQPSAPGIVAATAVSASSGEAQPVAAVMANSGEAPSKARRGKRGGRKHQAPGAVVDTVASSPRSAPATKSTAKSAKATKPSTRRTTKPRAG